MKIKTSEIKMLVKKCVAQGGTFTTEDFVNYISGMESKEMTSSQLAGALRQLTESGDIIRVERGLYTKRSMEAEESGKQSASREEGESKFVTDIIKSLEQTGASVGAIVNEVNVWELNEKEFALLCRIKKFKEDLDSMLIKCREEM